ncbi:hypothetical protein J1N35_012097 [Gossypium stocksii]|uniref:Uncharacterized protein n=1 Tax=Gossypium stocksii TaxID=47602 RepID=A0A9D4ADY1_9ROSI|nr:hypothetical protein J1N35_012097 [Gossypium stocksii]
MEAELKRLKVQANQWRKAAEAATAMLSNNGKYSDKTIPFDITIGSLKWESIDDDDDDGDDLSKEKNNMLRKIGVLWKKGNMPPRTIKGARSRPEPPSSLKDVPVKFKSKEAEAFFLTTRPHRIVKRYGILYAFMVG